MQDVNLILRDTLKSYMNSNEYTDKLKARWIYQRKIADAANGIQIEEKELDSVSHKEILFLNRIENFTKFKKIIFLGLVRNIEHEKIQTRCNATAANGRFKRKC
jgi:hypothetical protein